MRESGWSVTLVAPEGPGRIVVGTGPASADALLAWDAPGLAAVVGGGAADAATEERLAADAALVLSRSPELRSALETRVSRVLVRDPAPARAGSHASLQLLEGAVTLLADAHTAPLPDLDPGPGAELEARPLLDALPERFLAVHPGSGSARKNWPADRYAALVRRLSRGRPWLLVGGPADEAALGPLSDLEGAVLARDRPLRTLAATLRCAGLYVGNDSGVSHLAAAAGAPCLVLFGPTPPAVWRPLGRSVSVLEAPGGSLPGLDVATVAERARELWAI